MRATKPRQRRRGRKSPRQIGPTMFQSPHALKDILADAPENTAASPPGVAHQHPAQASPGLTPYPGSILDRKVDIAD
jgi:hypothetical protein